MSRNVSTPRVYQPMHQRMYSFTNQCIRTNVSTNVTLSVGAHQMPWFTLHECIDTIGHRLVSFVQIRYRFTTYHFVLSLLMSLVPQEFFLPHVFRITRYEPSVPRVLHAFVHTHVWTWWIRTRAHNFVPFTLLHLTSHVSWSCVSDRNLRQTQTFVGLPLTSHDYIRGHLPTLSLLNFFGFSFHLMDGD